MIHYFSTKLAEKYGVEKAVIINTFELCLQIDRLHKENLHDGRYWTATTYKALSGLIPYMSIKKISRLIQELVSTDKILLAHNYNKHPLDKTKWYAFTNEFTQYMRVHHE